MSVASAVARAAGKKPSRAKKTEPVPPPDAREVEAFPKRSVFYSWYMAKNKGGGASRRGSHALQAAEGCEVAFYYHRHLKLAPKKRPGRSDYYLDFGTLLHTGLAYHYAAKMARKPEWYIEQSDREQALINDALGKPEWLRNVKEILAAYERYEAGDPWDPIYCEEEFVTTVGEMDPDGDDEPAIEYKYEATCNGLVDKEDGTRELCTHVDEQNTHVAHVVEKVLKLPRLNDEILTCRPDLIVMRNGLNWIVDHKGASAGRDGTGRLKVLDDRYPDYSYIWQAMFNLHVVRKKIPIQGFILNRMKREVPYDFSRDLVMPSKRIYEKVPRAARAAVKRERDILLKIAKKEPLTPKPWLCSGFGGQGCEFARLCHVDSIEDRNTRVELEYFEDRD